MSDVLAAARADAAAKRNAVQAMRDQAAQLRADADKIDAEVAQLEHDAAEADADVQAIVSARAARGIVDEPAPAAEPAAPAQ
jgi:uncharacterized coiled-coil DUF342 family protein